MLPSTCTVAGSHKKDIIARSARFTVDETLEVLLGEGLQEIDSGGESDIEKDQCFLFHMSQMRTLTTAVDLA